MSKIGLTYDKVLFQSCSQEEYDALISYDVHTFYLVKDNDIYNLYVGNALIASGQAEEFFNDSERIQVSYDKVKFQQCVKDDYDALTEKSANTLYFIVDTNEIYLGEELFSSGRNASLENDGLMTKEDVSLLNELAGNPIVLRPKNNSITLETYNGAKYISVGISDDSLNIASIDDSGLFVPRSSYEILKQSTPDQGYLSTYFLQTVFNGSASIAGEKINIPLDCALLDVKIKRVTEEDKAVGGIFYNNDDFYLDDLYLDFYVGIVSTQEVKYHLYCNINCTQSHTNSYLSGNIYYC